MNTRPAHKETHLDWKWALTPKGLQRARRGVVIYLDQSKQRNAEQERRERWQTLLGKQS